MMIGPSPAGEPMNNVLLLYEYAGSPMLSVAGVFVTSERFICIVVFAICNS